MREREEGRALVLTPAIMQHGHPLQSQPVVLAHQPRPTPPQPNQLQLQQQSQPQPPSVLHNPHHPPPPPFAQQPHPQHHPLHPFESLGLRHPIDQETVMFILGNLGLATRAPHTLSPEEKVRWPAHVRASSSYWAAANFDGRTGRRSGSLRAHDGPAAASNASRHRRDEQVRRCALVYSCFAHRLTPPTAGCMRRGNWKRSESRAYTSET